MACYNEKKNLTNRMCIIFDWTLACVFMYVKIRALLRPEKIQINIVVELRNSVFAPPRT